MWKCVAFVEHRREKESLLLHVGRAAHSKDVRRWLKQLEMSVI